ncbi:MAG: hypothetical protein H0Z39_03680 [Peptococcaceae bacterium]|nr:hypothetical protein [Peptococcaceae bacterium]
MDDSEKRNKADKVVSINKFYIKDEMSYTMSMFAADAEDLIHLAKCCVIAGGELIGSVARLQRKLIHYLNGNRYEGSLPEEIISQMGAMFWETRRAQDALDDIAAQVEFLLALLPEDEWGDREWDEEAYRYAREELVTIMQGSAKAFNNLAHTYAGACKYIKDHGIKIGRQQEQFLEQLAVIAMSLGNLAQMVSAKACSETIME